MDPEKRRAMEQRRLVLREKLRLQPEVRGIKRTVDYLAAHGIDYMTGRDRGGELATWVVDRFPNIGYTTIRLDWSRHPGAVSGPDIGAPDDEVIAWFNALEASGRLGGDGEVVLTTDNGADPMIYVRFADIRAHPGLFALDGWVWWIVSQSGRWVMQYGDGEPWCWGREDGEIKEASRGKKKRQCGAEAAAKPPP